MGFGAIHIDSAPGALVEQVITRIESGELTPGTCLPSQRELAKRFQVGLGSVREAIKILTVLGHLEVIRGKGTYVRHPTPAGTDRCIGNSIASGPQHPLSSSIEAALQAVSLAELLQAREIIECGAAKLAAQEVSPTKVGQLKQLSATMTTAPETIDRYYQNDFSFHLAVAEATENRALINMVHLLLERVHHCLDFMNHSLGISLPINIERCVQTARQVIACIVAGEDEPAFHAMGTHLNVVRIQLDQNFMIPGQKKGFKTAAATAGAAGLEATSDNSHDA